MEKYDVIVIGSGPGGYVAAIRAAELGLKTACVEKETTVGGTCLNVGCIPSKSLLHDSENYFLMKNEGYHIAFDFDKMMEKKRGVISGLVKGIEGLFKQHKVDLIQGVARFLDPYTIEVGQKQYSGKNFILATGSEPTPLSIAPFDEKMILSSTGALSLSKVPKAMVVIGAGVIGVELASVYARLGTLVTVIEMLDLITPTIDETLGRALLQSLKKQGIIFHLGAKVSSIKVENDKALVTFDQSSILADRVLIAVGRRPFTKGLGLEAIGIDKIRVNNNFQTSHPHIYAIGDIIDGPMLAHKASDEGVAVAELIAGLKTEVQYITIPNVVYTFPEVGAVGLTEAEAKEMQLKIKVGVAYFKGNARARCSGYSEGLVKVIGDFTSGKLLGIHIFAPHASEMIGEGVIALQKGMTLQELAHASHAHPTLSETIKEAAMSAL